MNRIIMIVGALLVMFMARWSVILGSIHWALAVVGGVATFAVYIGTFAIIEHRTRN